MEIWPETRSSLILRLKDPEDGAAWSEFLTFYRPVMLRMARRRGVQDADAEDLAQRVLLAVAEKVAGWKPHSQETRFRNWLGRITRNAILNELSRSKPDRAAGAGMQDGILDHVPDRNELSAVLVFEARRRAAVMAAAAIEHEFSETTWAMFHQTAIEGRPAKEVAESLGRSVGAVYIARCRVMQRMKETIERWSGYWSDKS